MDIGLITDSKGKKGISLEDIIYNICYSDDNNKRSLLERIISLPDFAAAFEIVVRGDSEEEWSENRVLAADKLRALMAAHATPAMVVLVKSLTNQLIAMQGRLTDANVYIDKILKDWPEPYAKYKPKQDITFNYKYITDEHVQKMLEIIEEKEQP